MKKLRRFRAVQSDETILQELRELNIKMNALRDSSMEGAPMGSLMANMRNYKNMAKKLYSELSSSGKLIVMDDQSDLHEIKNCILFD